MNFIREISRFEIADFCVECFKYYPKYQFVFCFCCRNRVRIRGQQSKMKKFREQTREEISAIIKKKIDEGWRPVKY